MHASATSWSTREAPARVASIWSKPSGPVSSRLLPSLCDASTSSGSTRAASGHPSPDFRCGDPGERLDLPSLPSTPPVDTPAERLRPARLPPTSASSRWVRLAACSTPPTWREIWTKSARPWGSSRSPTWASLLRIRAGCLGSPRSSRSRSAPMVIDAADNPVDAEADRQGAGGRRNRGDGADRQLARAGAHGVADSAECPIYNNRRPRLAISGTPPRNCILSMKPAGKPSRRSLVCGWFRPSMRSFLWPVLWEALYLAQ